MAQSPLDRFRRHAAVCFAASLVPLALVSPSACGGAADSSAPCVGLDEAGRAADRSDAAADRDNASALPDSEAAFDAGEIGVFCEKTIGAVRDEFAGTCCSPADRARPAFSALGMFIEVTIEQCKSLAKARAAGRITWDPIAAQACIAHVRESLASHAGTCDGLPGSTDFFRDPACVGVVTGLGLDHAASCSGAVECAAGLTCGGVSSGGGGYCVPPVGLHGNCVEGLPLDAFPFGDHPAPCLPETYCSAGQCVARAGADGPCADDRECMPGLACHLSHCGTDVPHPAGGACHRGTDCEVGLYCQHVGVDLHGTCALRKTAGQACGGLDVGECRGVCVATSGAGPSGTCASFCGAP